MDDINTDEKKQDMFLNGLNGDIQFQLLNIDYIDFQHMVDKAIVIENRSRKWRRKASENLHSPDNFLETMLGPASHSLANSSDPHR
jgi:hypothetical protein